MLRRTTRSTTVVVAAAGIAAAATATAVATNGPVYVRPGAPGEPTQQISPSELTEAPTFPYTEADVTFMQHMLPHHGQALLMSEWALGHEEGESGDPTDEARAEDSQVQTLARRIQISQSGEIDRMVSWLERRDEDVPEVRSGVDHDHDMPGMVSPEDLEELESLEGHEFDVRFLELMIPHHRGAITMVHNLDDNGGGHEPNISALASSIVDDQRLEIALMEKLLGELRDD